MFRYLTDVLYGRQSTANAATKFLAELRCHQPDLKALARDSASSRETPGGWRETLPSSRRLKAAGRTLGTGEDSVPSLATWITSLASCPTSRGGLESRRQRAGVAVRPYCACHRSFMWSTCAADDVLPSSRCSVVLLLPDLDRRTQRQGRPPRTPASTPARTSARRRRVVAPDLTVVRLRDERRRVDPFLAAT